VSKKKSNLKLLIISILFLRIPFHVVKPPPNYINRSASPDIQKLGFLERHLLAAIDRCIEYDRTNRSVFRFPSLSFDFNRQRLSMVRMGALCLIPNDIVYVIPPVEESGVSAGISPRYHGMLKITDLFLVNENVFVTGLGVEMKEESLSDYNKSIIKMPVEVKVRENGKNMMGQLIEVRWICAKYYPHFPEAGLYLKARPIENLPWLRKDQK
jgi:hypothetical protein